MPEQAGIDDPLSAQSAGGEVRAGKTHRYKGALNEGEVDMLYTPNGCIYNDGGTLVRCNDFTPRHMDGFWALQQHFNRYTEAVRHRKELRKNGNIHLKS